MREEMKKRTPEIFKLVCQRSRVKTENRTAYARTRNALKHKFDFYKLPG